MYIYFHEDFDGIISAALVAMYFRDEHKDHDIHFHPVDYYMKYWESTALKSPSCVVDFKYHPNCDYWFDHHHDADKDIDKIREQYSDKYKSKNQKLYCDPKARSCASMIYSKLLRNNRCCRDLSAAADYIDNAQYHDANEACFGQGKIKKLNRIITNKTYSLSGICHGLFITQSIYKTLNTEEFIEAHKDAWYIECKRFIRYLDKSGSVMNNSIVEYDMLNKRQFNRYLPFWEYSECEYAVGITGTDDQIRIAVSKNPWNNEPGRLHVGKLCKRLGGGGHEDVGSVRTNSIFKADNIYDEIINELESCD